MNKMSNFIKVEKLMNPIICIQICNFPCYLKNFHFPPLMNPPINPSQNPETDHPRTPQRITPMIDEQFQESNNFTQRQIQIIRSYIGNLNLDPKQKHDELVQLAEKIRKETQLQAKSAKQIQVMIYKLLYPQSTSRESKNIEASMAGFYQPQNQEIQKSPFSEMPQKPTPAENRSQTIQIPQVENMFVNKSLFKSFNEPSENGEAKESQKFGYTEDNKFQSIRKTNLFTKPSVELPKSYASNGFLSVAENNLLPNRKMSMEVQRNNEVVVEFPSFSKKATKEFKQTAQLNQTKQKRKILPKNSLQIDPQLTPQQKIEWIDTNTTDCHTIIQKKPIKKTGNPLKDSYFVNQRFSSIFNEYFYSNYDKAFFNQQNYFSKLASYLGLDPKKMTFKEFRLLKHALPKPKHFNIEFVISQQNKLNEFRSQLRQIPKERTKSEDIELVVGRQVTALHPVCGHLHGGTILAIYKQNQYMVKFTRPELGTQKILDINICTRSLASTNKAVIQNLDFEAMAIVIKLLEYKGELLERFKEYNDVMEELREEGKQPENQLLQEYGWIGSAINILSMGMKHIMAKFRIRGLNASNQQLVGKNFSALLTNPLSLMSKQLQNSSDFSDIQTSNQIKKMTSIRQNDRINESLKSLTVRNSHYIEQSEMNPQQKENVMLLLKNFIGMILNFRFEGRNFSIETNKYLHNIHKLIDTEYTEEFNEIYASVHSIVKKISQSE